MFDFQDLHIHSFDGKVYNVMNGVINLSHEKKYFPHEFCQIHSFVNKVIRDMNYSVRLPFFHMNLIKFENIVKQGLTNGTI